MRTEYTLTPEQRKDFFESEGEKCLVKNGIRFYPKHRVRQYAMSLQNLYPKLGNLWPSR